MFMNLIEIYLIESRTRLGLAWYFKYDQSYKLGQEAITNSYK